MVFVAITRERSLTSMIEIQIRYSLHGNASTDHVYVLPAITVPFNSSVISNSVSCKFFDRQKPSGDNSSAVIPDFWVTPSLEEFTRGDDPVLKFVMDRLAHRT